MFSWFFRSTRPVSSSNVRRVRPRLEALESRFCPTKLTHLANLEIMWQTANIGGVAHQASPGGEVISGPSQSGSDGLMGIPKHAAKVELAETLPTRSPSKNAGKHVQAADEGEGPTITSFKIVYEGNGLWTFSGSVVDADPGTVTVEFSGLQSLTQDNNTVQCDSNGNFNVLIMLTTQVGDSGTVTATAIDGSGVTDTALYYIVNQM